MGATLKLVASGVDGGSEAGIVNDGYWGIPTKPKTTYRASFYAKASSSITGPVTVSIRNANGDLTIATAQVSHVSSEWTKYTVELHTGNTGASLDNRFVISVHQTGTIWFRDVSLFQPTFHNRPNGNRIDLMEILGELKPSFLRLPGGNYLEGDTIDERFEWKNTIGDISTRAGHQGPWGYRSSDGLGLLEFLEWCEDLHMQPLLAVYAGYSLKGAHVEPGADLKPFVDDALDEIEYVTGSTQTKWGAERAKNGHPKPFPLNYVEIGNEDWFDRSGTYEARFAQFFDAIKAKYPKLQLIATGPIKSRKPDVIDDHYYRSAAEMARDSGHYDKYDRSGSKIFVGEWASIGGNPTPTFNEALGDAAWLTGLERNSDLVVMEAYAPLLVNVNPRGSQWPTNLIGYNGLTSFGSPSYYVQSIFAKYTGEKVLPVSVKLSNTITPPLPTPHGSIGLGTWITDSEYKDVEVTANGETLYKKDFAQGITDWRRRSGTWKVEDGALRQSTQAEDTHITAGDAKWTDYTYHVKAKKLGGAEGFLIVFHAQNRNDYLQWNVGGWGNTRSAIQRHLDGSIDELGQATDTTVETGRWYDIRIELHGTEIKCYLDDKLITTVTETPRPLVAPIYAASSISKSGDVYLKIVNVSGETISTDIDLAGTGQFASAASGLILTGQKTDANSVAEPFKVAPKPIKLSVKGATINHAFPPYSITVVRLRQAGDHPYELIGGDGE
jgi:alpha-L-arabinofuranosidase